MHEIWYQLTWSRLFYLKTETVNDGDKVAFLSSDTFKTVVAFLQFKEMLSIYLKEYKSGVLPLVSDTVLIILSRMTLGNYLSSFEN